MVHVLRRWVLLMVVVAAGCALHGAPPLGVSSSQPSAGVKPAMVIGLCEDYPEESRSIAAARRDLDLLKSCGVSHLRVGLGWDGIEPRPGEFDWTFWDQLFDEAERRHITLLPYVCYTPKWAAGKGEHHWRQPPKDAAAFGRFMSAAAERYRGRARSWELWNEPDNPDYWEGSREAFARLVRAGAAAVRRADPQARVVLGGIAWETDFIAEMLQDYDLADDVDVINLHAYFETWSPEALESLPRLINRVHDLIARHGDGEAIWMAEVGYSDYRKGAAVSAIYSAKYDYEHTARYQADALARTAALIASTGKVELMAWYRVNDLPTTQDVIGDVNNRHLGVADVNGQEKPAAAMLRRMVRVLGGASGSLDDATHIEKRIAADAHVRTFSRADGGVIVTAWLPTCVPGSGIVPEGDAADGRVETVTVTVPGRPPVDLTLRGGETTILEIP